MERDLNMSMLKSFKEIKKIFGLQKEDNNNKSRTSEYGKNLIKILKVKNTWLLK